MVAPGDLILVAISAGPDSTALLRALHRLRRRLGCRLCACHVHHGLRGPDADADAEAAAALARALRVPFTARRAEVRELARARGLSLEAAARAVRYQLLEEEARRARASRIATGHTADDQAETVLLNLLRGAGPAGLAGIPPVRGKIIRPLLRTTRAEVQAYCAAEGLDYRVDATNADPAFLRNRLRLQVLPLLRRLQPRVDAALCRLADIARLENDYLAAAAQRALRDTAALGARQVRIAREPFCALPEALRRRVLRAAVARLKGDELDLEFDRVEALVALVESGRTGATIELPGGLRAERAYGGVIISAAAPERAPPGGEWTLPVPGEVVIEELGVRFTAVRSRARRTPSDPWAALVDAARVKPPLTVRTWRQGDRFHPLGMRGSVKLQDFFVNQKVPRRERARVPLLLAGGEIVWVVGHRLDDRCKVTPRTKRTIKLEAQRLRAQD